MKFGSREIANVVFRAKSRMKLGNKTFNPGQPVLYIDTATTSSMEQAVTTVYAQGGRSNTRLIAWDGDKTLTFTVEDALLSPVGLSILAGAGLLKGSESDQVHIHTMTSTIVGTGGVIDLAKAVEGTNGICFEAPVFVMGTDTDGSLNGDSFKITAHEGTKITTDCEEGENVMVDYYVLKNSNNVSEIQIKPETLTSNFYVEADTLYRRQDTGVDMPAILTFPNVKVQSNFTISMAATGDPQTFSFVMDAFPDYTYFNKDDKVLCAIQIVEDAVAMKDESTTVFGEADQYEGAGSVLDHEWIPTGEDMTYEDIFDGKVTP